MALSFAYLTSKLSKSVLRIDMTKRIVHALLLSIFWFVTFPIMLINGRLLKCQSKTDEKLYNLYVDKQIEFVVKKMKECGKVTDQNEDEITNRLKNEMGDYQRMMSDMIYFSRATSKDELAGLIAYRYCKKERVSEIYKNYDPEKFVLSKVNNLVSLVTPMNNWIDCGDIKNKYKGDNIFRDLLGFHTLSTGLTFLGTVSDTEYPFFFIVYYDGEDLKSFVPRHNFYNRLNKKPFGVNKESDSLFLDLIYGEGTSYDYFSRKINSGKVLDEIQNQVNFLPRRGESPKFGWENIIFEKEEKNEH